nr:uncharacterized protein LOC127490200 isoform X1 [Oryctolagus cuniculus]XP_051698344.1 uncharacterized protein LOC127490200 isoform X1 [Oryctolagus cuniculus]
MHWWESAPCPLLPRALRSRLQRWWLNLRRPRALQTQAGIRLHTQRRKQKLREMPRIPQCPVPACPKILTPHNCIHGGESRSLEKCQESPCAQPVQNSDTSELHTRRRKQKLRETPRIPLCCVPGCPKILTPHTLWSSSLEHVLSHGPKNKEVSSQEQYLQGGPGCWCQRSGSGFNRTLRFVHPCLVSLLEMLVRIIHIFIYYKFNIICAK